MAQERAKAIFWTVLIAVPVGKAASTLNDIRRGAKVFIPEKVTLETREVADKSIDGNLVRSPKFLDNDGSIKWPDHKGFELDSLGNPLKEPVVLQKGDIVDCYGDPFGIFTSLVNDGHSVSFMSEGYPILTSVSIKNIININLYKILI